MTLDKIGCIVNIAMKITSKLFSHSKIDERDNYSQFIEPPSKYSFVEYSYNI